MSLAVFYQRISGEAKLIRNLDPAICRLPTFHLTVFFTPPFHVLPNHFSKFSLFSCWKLFFYSAASDDGRIDFCALVIRFKYVKVVQHSQFSLVSYGFWAGWWLVYVCHFSRFHCVTMTSELPEWNIKRTQNIILCYFCVLLCVDCRFGLMEASSPVSMTTRGLKRWIRFVCALLGLFAKAWEWRNDEMRLNNSPCYLQFIHTYERALSWMFDALSFIPELHELRKLLTEPFWISLNASTRAYMNPNENEREWNVNNARKQFFHVTQF